MQSIDLKRLVDELSLDVKALAAQLYPNIKHPRLAFNRAYKGEASLDDLQISKLALFAGVPVRDLYSGRNWVKQSKKGVHVFTEDNWRAELDTNTWITQLFHNHSLFHESILHAGAISLEDYYPLLEEKIQNHIQCNSLK